MADDRLLQEAPGFDVIVLGGGPAGAVSAWLAAHDGLSVLLVDPLRPSGRIEGLSPRLHRWLTARPGLGTGDGVIGFLERHVDWSGQAATANREFLVDRDRLDAHLRRQAMAAGATLLRTTGRPDKDAVLLADGRRVPARWILDARGRRAVGRDASRRPPFATVSIFGWITAAHDLPPGIGITALPEGWIWRAVLPDGRLWAQLTCDARAEASPPDRLVEALRGSVPALTDHHLAAEPRAAEAAPVLPAPVDDLRCLPVGDALAAMDPLSGHGMFWAVSSALSVAAVRRTLAARPGAGTEALCRRFLRERAHRTYLRNARIGRDFLRLETRFAQEPFWAVRCTFPDDLPAHDAPDEITICRGPVVRNGLVEDMDLLRTPRSPDGIAWFGTIPAAEAWRLLSAGHSAEDLARRWGNAVLTLPRLLREERTPRPLP